MLNDRARVRDRVRVLRAVAMSNDLWAVIEPVLLPRRTWGTSVERSSVDWGRDRLAIPGHRGAMSRKKCGSVTVGWLDEGTYVRMFAAVLAAAAECDAQRERVLSFDSTIVRVHQHLPAHD